MASITSGLWWSVRHTFLLLLCFKALTASEDATIDGKSWLRRYGYLNSTDSSSGASHSVQDLSEAIREMQRFYNLEVTGQMDQQTTTAMKRPRCGVPDKTKEGRSSYEAAGSKWDKHTLTYSIENFAPNIAWHETFEAIRRAFKVWGKVIPLTFEEIPYEEIHHGRRNEADIMLSFQSGPHKGHGPFGPTELAHASYPGGGGDVHFHSDKQWSNTNQDMQDSYNVFLVAVHELGHSLGLDHSSDPVSIMYPDYHWMDTENFQLPADDRQGIQHIYRVTCPSGWTTFEDRCYYRTTGGYTWQEARDYCQSQGADLVVINSPEEQAFIRGLINGDYHSWISLKRSNVGSRWMWVDGTPLTTQYWGVGEPDNHEDRNCAYYRHRRPTDSGTWYNGSCSYPRYAICKK